MTVYAIDQQTFAPLLINRPALAEDLALSLSRRSQQSRSVLPRVLNRVRVRVPVGIQTIFHRSPIGAQHCLVNLAGKPSVVAHQVSLIYF